MCSSYVRQIPMNQLGLTLDGPVAWFWRRRVADVRGWPGNEPAEQYTLSFMLEVIRAAGGPDWLPGRLKLECAPSGWAAATSRVPGVRIEYDQPLLADHAAAQVQQTQVDHAHLRRHRIAGAAGREVAVDSSRAVTMRAWVRNMASGISQCSQAPHRR